MNLKAKLAITLAAAGVTSLAGSLAWVWVKLRRKRDPAEIERLRRLEVNRCGRISAGKILDFVESKAGATPARLLVYQYEVGGVTYEAAQDITRLPNLAPVAAYLPGQTISVKFDPKLPTNSIIACEEWSGIVCPADERVAPSLKNKSVLAQ